MSSVLGYFENLHEQKDPASFMMLFGDHGPDTKNNQYVESVNDSGLSVKLISYTEE